MEESRNIISFIKEIERLKSNTRTAWTSTGRHESIAEHSWRLSLFTMVLGEYFPHIDSHKILCMALIHDLGEAYDGDTSAKIAANPKGKLKKEEEAIVNLTEVLPQEIQQQFIDLWWEYNKDETEEAKLVKALDKIETIIQHNQGNNPPDFDYNFNLEYGKEYSRFDPVIQLIREFVDEDTLQTIKECNYLNENYKGDNQMNSDVWEAVLVVIRSRISTASFDTWFKPSRASKEGTHWIIISENKFAKDWLESRYDPLIRDAILEITGEVPEVEFACDKNDIADSYSDDKVNYIVSQINRLTSKEKVKLFGMLDVELERTGKPNVKKTDIADNQNRMDQLEMEMEQLKNQVRKLSN